MGKTFRKDDKFSEKFRKEEERRRKRIEKEKEQWGEDSEEDDLPDAPRQYRERESKYDNRKR